VVAVITSLLFASCKGSEFQLSLDSGKLRYKDKINDDSDANKSSATFNMAMMIWLASNGTHPARNVFINSGLTPGDYLHHGGFEMNVLHTDEAPAFTPAPTWLQELFLYTGIELIGRRSHEGLVKTNLTYLKIPAFIIHAEKVERGHVFGGLGPYIAYGIGGQTKLTFNGNTDKHPSFDKEDGYKRFDAGINWTAGYRFENDLQLRLAFDIGLINIAQADSEFREWNRTFGINVSWPVSRIKEKLNLN
jgi:hypothetical protein